MSSASTRTKAAPQQGFIGVTAQQGRHTLFINQLRASSLFLVQTMAKVLLPPNPTISEESISTKIEALRKKIRLEVKKDPEMYNSFYNQVTKAYPFMARIIEEAVRAQLILLQLISLAPVNTDGSYVAEPIHKLWNFLLRTIYEKPGILLFNESKLPEHDLLFGTNIDYIRNLMPEFIAEITPLQWKNEALTFEALQSHLKDIGQPTSPSHSSVSHAHLQIQAALSAGLSAPVSQGTQAAQVTQTSQQQATQVAHQQVTHQQVTHQQQVSAPAKLSSVKVSPVKLSPIQPQVKKSSSHYEDEDETIYITL